MIYDLVEVPQKKNKLKIILIVIISLLIITIFAASGIAVAKYINGNSNNKIAGILENTNQTEEQKEDIGQQKEEIKGQDKENKQDITQVEKVAISKNITDVSEFSQKSKDNIAHIYHNDTDEKIAYLTFDDGPSRTVTPLLLDLLKQENIKATFFLLGSRVELYPDLVKREYEEGHYIANHGYSHVYSSIYQSADAVLDEYTKTESAIQNILGKPDFKSHLFRFPGGSVGGKYKDIKAQAKELLAQNDIGYVDWNALTQDAAGKHTKEQLIENLKGTVGEKKTVVILMHDGGDKILTYEALPEIISYLREKGYTFKSFYDVIE